MHALFLGMKMLSLMMVKMEVEGWMPPMAVGEGTPVTHPRSPAPNRTVALETRTDGSIN